MHYIACIILPQVLSKVTYTHDNILIMQDFTYRDAFTVRCDDVEGDGLLERMKNRWVWGEGAGCDHV